MKRNNIFYRLPKTEPKVEPREEAPQLLRRTQSSLDLRSNSGVIPAIVVTPPPKPGK